MFVAQRPTIADVPRFLFSKKSPISEGAAWMEQSGQTQTQWRVEISVQIPPDIRGAARNRPVTVGVFVKNRASGTTYPCAI